MINPVYRKKPRKTSRDIFEQQTQLLLSNLGVKSVNHTLPPLPTKLAYSDEWFKSLEAILYEHIQRNTVDGNPEE